MMKRFTALSVFLLTCIAAMSQRPIVNSISKATGPVNETITITGSNFPATIPNTLVYFGAGKGTVTSASSTQIEVTVPITATTGPVSVMDVTSGLFGTSKEFFTLSYGGSAFSTGQLDAQVDFPTNNDDTYDICTCDFDNDGKLDVALSNRAINSDISVYRNTSTVSSTSFALTNIANPFPSINIECGDLNGDGLPEIIATNDDANQPDIFVFRNTGAISFTRDISIKLPNVSASVNRSSRRAALADINGDGKKDLIVGSNADASFFIYLNTSNPSGTISINSSPDMFSLSGPTNAGSLTAGDIDNDGLPDIVVLPFEASNEDIYILKNTSTLNKVNFEAPVQAGVSNRGVEVILADFNEDGLLDMATTNRQGNDLNIIPNTTTTSISFGAEYQKTATSPWGLAAADFNGDGHIDIVTGSVSTGSGLDVFLNTFSGSGLSFDDAVNIPTTLTIRNLDAGDLNGDGKPDFALTHNITLNAPGDFTAVINRNCFSPVIAPANITFCQNSPFEVSATNSVETTYNWTLTGTGTTNGSDSDTVEINVTGGTSATIEVTIVSNDGSCAGVGQNTTQQVYTIAGGTPPAPPTITVNPAGTICAGDNFSLEGPASQTNYFWTLPDGTEVQQTSATLNITNATAADAGAYKLRVQGADCTSEEGTRSVLVNENPGIIVINSGADDFCATSSVDLQAASYSGYTYQWQDGAGDITGETDTLITVSNTGNYSLELTNGTTGCVSTSSPYTVTAVAVPGSNFTAPSGICQNTPMSVSATSSGQSGYALTYSWDFGDGSFTTPSASTDANNTYTATGDTTIRLVTGYNIVDGCTDTTSKIISITAAPSASDIEQLITPAPSAREKCPEDTMTLSLPTGYQSYAWTIAGQTISTSNTADAFTAFGEDTVTVTVDVVTNIGCLVPGITAEVRNYANSQILISALDAQAVNDTIVLGDRVSSVTLSAENGSDYSWVPAEIMDNGQSATTVVRPRSGSVTVYVTGTDAVNGCVTTASVFIQIPGVIPRKSFSPNGDGIGYDCWEILNSDDLQGCTLYIMDERGKYIYKGNSPFDQNCAWNGNLNNSTSPVPEGIYYFVLKCEDSNINQAGSILLGR